MASNLKGLIKLRKSELDDRRRTHGELLKRERILMDAEAKLGQSVRKEAAFVASEGGEWSAALTGYLEGVRRQRLKLRRQQLELKREIARSTEDIRLAFEALKQIEKVAENRILAAEAEKKRKEVIELDDIAVERHRRSGP